MPHIAYCTDRKDLATSGRLRWQTISPTSKPSLIVSRSRVLSPRARMAAPRPGFIYHTDDREEARQLENDPTKAGVYGEVVLSFFTPAAAAGLAAKSGDHRRRQGLSTLKHSLLTVFGEGLGGSSRPVPAVAGGGR